MGPGPNKEQSTPQIISSQWLLRHDWQLSLWSASEVTTEAPRNVERRVTLVTFNNLDCLFLPDQYSLDTGPEWRHQHKMAALLSQREEVETCRPSLYAVCGLN